MARSILPPALRRAARLVWEDLRDWADAVVFGLHFVAARRPLPRLVLFFGFAPGDDLLCTVVLRELRKRGKHGMMMVSNHAELFKGNSDPEYIRPLWSRYFSYDSTAAICQRFARIWGSHVVQPEYAPPMGHDRQRPPSRHVIVEMCAKAGITGSVLVRPYITLSEAERSSAEWTKGHIIIQTSGKGARQPAQNKNWYPERFQEVVDALCSDVEFTQMGSSDDPPLRGVRDLRGATTIREAAAILSHARLYVGHEGFLMHLARATECPSVIIFGGRSTPEQLGYTCNSNLYSPVPCSPCWRANTCDFNRQCMQAISVADVVTAIREMLARPRNPLCTETVEITSAPDSRLA